MSDLRLLLHGSMLALVWFLCVNAVASLIVIGVAARLIRQDRRQASGVWLGLRLLPAGVSIALVAGVFIPSYWIHEPRGYSEGVDVVLALVALAALVVGGSAIARGAAAWVRTSKRAQAWMRAGQPSTLVGTSMRVFEVDAEPPIVALVGVLRPRLFITRRVVGVLTSEELAVSVAHELGHWRALDNLKRLAMRSAPDLLATTSMARLLEQRWTSASEHLADLSACEQANVADRTRARCALASAIVKVARLLPPVAPNAEPICTLVDGDEIASRVRSLLDDGGPAVARRRSRPRWIAAGLAVAALAFGYAPLLRAVHVATEFLVHTLP